jgi:hypothetical protein
MQPETPIDINTPNVSQLSILAVNFLEFIAAERIVGDEIRATPNRRVQ